MTRDVCYVVRLEQGDKEYWLGQSDTGDYFACLELQLAAHFDNEDDVKAALKSYYEDTHEMKDNERAFVCKVSVSDCACFVKSDIDLLLKKNA